MLADVDADFAGDDTEDIWAEVEDSEGDLDDPVMLTQADDCKLKGKVNVKKPVKALSKKNITAMKVNSKAKVDAAK